MKFPNQHFHEFYYHNQSIEKALWQDTPLINLPSIPEFYANREIFITGGSGFIGKILIEKLLRSCPDIKAIYILLRPKKGQTVIERKESICDQIVFDALRIMNPRFMEKIVPINGNVAELGLGLSEDDKKLMKNVSIIFHSAASVRFDDTLKDAVLMNTRGTLELMKFAETLTNIKVIMHVSTTYSNVQLSTVKEEIYPEITDWRKTIEICETLDDESLDCLTVKFVNFMPNTYVFSKNLAEHVSDEYKDRLPLILFRPSIVLNAWEEPFAGYVENFNGPVGILLASHIGISKTMYCDKDNIMDLIPVDICAKAMIIAAWKRAHEPISDKLPVVNAASANHIRATVKQLLDIGINGCCDEFPMGNLTLSVPSGGVTLNPLWNLIRLFFFQIIPAFLMDTALKMKGKRPRLMKIQRKMYEANKALSYFVTHNWNFHNDNFINLSTYLKAEDLRAFEYRPYLKISILLYARFILYGFRRYLMKLRDEDIEKDKQKLKRLKIATIIFKYIFYLSAFFVICKFLRMTYR